MNPKDVLIAKEILFALQHTGFRVFPNFYTNWHYDDKAAQKYLLEALGAPLVPSYVFFNKKEAIKWVEKVKFPKVFKLKGGAGSTNVKLINTKAEGIKIVKKAFGNGFNLFNPYSRFLERLRKFRKGKGSFKDLVRGFARLIYPSELEKIVGKIKGYVYFQDFVPKNNSDTRIIVIDQKAFALKRYVRSNDFRASGSGNFEYKREAFDERCISIALDLTDKLNAQCLAYDFVFDENNDPLIVEISYGFSPSGYDDCPGYWDQYLNWYEGAFNPYGWMVEMVRKED